MENSLSLKLKIDEYRSLSGEEAKNFLKEVLADINNGIEEAALSQSDRAFFVSILNEEPMLEKILEIFPLKSLFKFFRSLKDESSPIAEQVLNVLRRSPLLRKINAEDEVEKWYSLMLEYIRKHNFNLYKLFHQRYKEYSDKTLFKVLRGGAVTAISWEEAWLRVEAIGRALMGAIDGKAPKRVGIFSRNSPEMALTDLACLITGIPNAMIPADSSSNQLHFMLTHSEVDIVFIGEDRLYEIFRPVQKQIPSLRRVIALKPLTDKNIKTLASFMDEEGELIPAEEWREKALSVDIEKPLTVMYTSGTTGESKGIIFSQRHMISKRYARALALPEIGSGDTFLCYLPLFHTFGRYFELQGALFWGATYAFAEKPAIEVLLRNFAMVNPSVFISIPKKWKQLYEEISKRIDVEISPEEEIEVIVKEVTGGKLRWGLSAAGYLAPEIFRFFQKYGVFLLSGFGMTEATGGILMTPPGKYKDDSLGIPLPGVETMLSEEGELWIRGVYIFDEYLNPPAGVKPRNEKGWFETGDIMVRDSDGAYTIIDRKKEIYKNVKGQTVAPQKIENYFREFKSIKHIYLVGDQKEYNTVLIVPDYEFSDGYLRQLTDSEFRDFFSSLIVSVNRFLAPYERIVDFAILRRDFDPEKELTPKGTYRRKIIEKNFSEIIDGLYKTPWLSLSNGELELRLPNWYLRDRGITGYELEFSGKKLYHKKNNEMISVEYNKEKNELLLGNYLYRIDRPMVDFAGIFMKPELWLGNREFVNFFGGDLMFGSKMAVSADTNIKFIEIAAPTDDDEDPRSVVFRPEESRKNALFKIHNALVNIFARIEEGKETALEFIVDYLSRDYGDYREYILNTLRKLPAFLPLHWRQRIFIELISFESMNEFLQTTSGLWVTQPDILDRTTMLAITERKLSDKKVKQVLHFTKCYFYRFLETIRPDQIDRLRRLLEFLTVYTNVHPTQYKIAREILVQYILQRKNQSVATFAEHYFKEMNENLREWLGTNQQLVIDPESGLEYRWDDVIIFDENIDFAQKNLIVKAIKEVPVIKETIFIFNRFNVVQLRDIPQGGIWISRLNGSESEERYRVSIQTRSGEAYDLVLSINHSIPDDKLQHYLKILIICGETEEESALTDEFGSFWPDYRIWTKQYISAETSGHYLSRKIRQNKESDLVKIKGQWPNFFWSSLMLALQFWKRVGKLYMLKDMSVDNFIVPLSDYQVGAKIKEIDYREVNGNHGKIITEFWRQFLEKSREKYGDILPEVDPMIVPYAVIEALGEKEGFNFLKDTLAYLKDEPDEKLSSELIEAIESVLTDDKYWKYYPRRLYFAIARYHRWRKLSGNVDPEANASMISELFQTYQLDELEKVLPDARIRFYCDTVFASSSDDFRKGLEEIMSTVRKEKPEKEKYTELVASLLNRYRVSKDEEFFLTRLTHPYLMPHDAATFVELEEEGKRKTEIVVYFYDSEGDRYIIRGPVNPKEVAKLYHLFLQANLPVQFRPEHKFLVAFNDRGVLIGGLFYYFKNRESVRLEKIVVKMPFRRKKVSSKIINEFFSRLRNIGVKSVSTGFYRPEFFYKFNFKVENRYEGLVKDLTIPDKAEPEE